MAYDLVLVERRGAVGVVTLNRPDKLNAFNLALSHDLRDAVAELDADPDVGAIVMTGAGRAFSAGGDLGRIESMARVAPEQPSLPNLYWLEQMRACKPVIAAINGLCIGAAFARVLCCDVRIASTGATFCARFAALGIGPEIGITQTLPHLIGPQAAADLFFSARTIDAAEALRLGLVLKVVEPDQLMDAAVGLAAEYAANSPGAVRAIKRLLHVNRLQAEATMVLRNEGEAQQALAGQPDMLEAMAALKARRAPDFRAAPTRAGEATP
jgi:enoyl-CoA hydratase/carnithine racemase